MEPKFQKGQKVRIKENFKKIPTRGSLLAVNPRMEPFAGREVTIQNIIKQPDFSKEYEHYRYQLEGVDFYWHENWLEELKKEDEPTVFYVSRPEASLGSAILERGEKLGYTPSFGFERDPENWYPAGYNGILFFSNHSYQFNMGFYTFDLVKIYPNPKRVTLDEFFSDNVYQFESYFGKPKPLPPDIDDMPVEWNEEAQCIEYNNAVYTVIQLKDLLAVMSYIESSHGYEPNLEVGCVNITPKKIKDIIEYANYKKGKK